MTCIFLIIFIFLMARISQNWNIDWANSMPAIFIGKTNKNKTGGLRAFARCQEEENSDIFLSNS